eukprot:scaffold129955_cov17-Tisochrysis_lutea.AAC.1
MSMAKMGMDPRNTASALGLGSEFMPVRLCKERVCKWDWEGIGAQIIQCPLSKLFKLVRVCREKRAGKNVQGCLGSQMAVCNCMH